jgi:two-component system sensor histidine kinase MtrB
MPDRGVSPGRLRRRLTLAFVLVAGVSAAALALGSYVVVRENRLDDSVERALDQARSNFLVADEILEGTAGPATEEVLDALARRGEFATVGTVGDAPFSSSLSLAARDVPADLRRAVAGGELAYQRVSVREAPYLVVGGRVAGSDLDLYFFFEESELHQELDQLRTILLVGVGALALLAGIVGSVLARRTLAPVARASTAARSLAEGLLETRLPVERADEFGVWAASFNEMADALQSKIAALSEAQARERRFTSDVAHELRTPLTALVAEASLLAGELERLPPDARRPAELLIADVDRARRLVEDLMEISRLDAGAEGVRLEPVDLGEAVSASVRGQDGDGRVSVEDRGVTVETDRRRLERIVANLVGNALEHGEGGVLVRVDRDGDAALVEVADHGPGIPPEHLPFVFERFYKADRSRTSAGSGLGLAIARENALLLGGDIAVTSRVGAGTRFTLRLPVTQPLRAGDGSVSREDEHEPP